MRFYENLQKTSENRNEPSLSPSIWCRYADGFVFIKNMIQKKRTVVLTIHLVRTSVRFLQHHDI